MANETTITIIGNLTDSPELRFTSNGTPVANFTIASTPRMFDKQRNEWVDQDTLFLRCAVWREAAENVAESLRKGARVIAQGRLKARSYETKEGEKRTSTELEVEEVGPSLKYARAQVERTPQGGSQGGGRGNAQGGGWGSQGGPQGGGWGGPQGGAGDPGSWGNGGDLPPY